MNPPEVDVTVIMRTKNSADTVAQALASLYSQTVRPLELLVVDSGSTDNTLDIVRSFPARILSIRPNDYFPGPVLNRCAKESRGQTLVFQNSDVVLLGPHALAELIRPLREPSVRATFARQIPRPEAEDWVRRDYTVAFPATGCAPTWLPYSLPFASMTKKSWETRPFYNAAWASEDTEWGHWAKRNHWDIQYVPTSEVMHSHNYSLREIYARRFVEGEADAFIYGSRPAPSSPLARLGRSVLSDALYMLPRGSVDAALRSVPRRIAFHLGHLRGLKWGMARMRRGDARREIGQQVVLSTHR